MTAVHVACAGDDPPREVPSALFVTSHFCAPTWRKTDVHLIAEALCRMGWQVGIVTVGQSFAKRLISPGTARHVRATNKMTAGLSAHVAEEWLHPPSGKGWLVTAATAEIVRRYGRRLDRRTQALAREARLVVVEAGYPLLYAEALAVAAPFAARVAFVNDDLGVVGFRDDVVARAQAALASFDLVRVPAERLLVGLPSGVRRLHLPHGTDPRLRRGAGPSPFQERFEAGSRHVVSVGNMLFDEKTVVAMAETRPGVFFHVIGATFGSRRLPLNIVCHGELPFDQTLGFLAHADAGLAPYRRVAGMEYLAQSSMKIRQYLACSLPVLMPRHLAAPDGAVFTYDGVDHADLGDAIDRALECEGHAEPANVLTWDDVAARLLAAVDLGVVGRDVEPVA